MRSRAPAPGSGLPSAVRTGHATGSAVMAEIALSDIDLFDDASLIDPFDDYRRLRDLGPVVGLVRPDMYALARFDDVRDALRASDVLKSLEASALGRV